MKTNVKKVISITSLAMFLSVIMGYAQIINTVVGTGGFGFGGDSGQAILATIDTPFEICLDPAGNIYIADYANQRIRMVNASTGVITTIAGTGVLGYSGDGGLAINAKISNARGIAVDDLGNVYISDNGNNRIRKIDASTGIITTIAGTGNYAYSGDGGLAINAELKLPMGICLDAFSNIYFTETGSDVVRKIDVATGIITTVAGTGTSGITLDGGLAINSALEEPWSVAVDVLGNVYISERNNNKIRKVNATTGILTTITGNGSPGSSGDGGDATLAQIDGPRDIFVNSSGDIFFADSDNNKIRKINASDNIITTLAGIGGPGAFMGDGGLAINARLNAPSGLCVSASGVVFISDSGNNRIRNISTTVTSMNESSEFEGIVNLFPNPATEIINISGIESEAVVSLYDITGKLVFERLISNEISQIDISHLEKGLYLIILETNQEIKVLKIVLTEE